MTQDKTLYEIKHEELIERLREELGEKIEYYSYPYDKEEEESEESLILRDEIEVGSLTNYPNCINSVDIKILFDSCFNYKGIFSFLNEWLEECYINGFVEECYKDLDYPPAFRSTIGGDADRYFNIPKHEREPREDYISERAKRAGKLMVGKYPFSEPFKAAFIEAYAGELEAAFVQAAFTEDYTGGLEAAEGTNSNK